MPNTWTDGQAAFAAALTDARLPPPVDVIECGGPGPRRGFAVYRNNSVMALIGALAERFPVTLQLVGEEFFRAMARSYAGAHRPRTPLLMHYGDDFPDFIARFAPAETVPYLPDVARLEFAVGEAYHAADAEPLDLRVFAATTPAALLECRLTLHPSTRILRSAYPVADIWLAHQGAGRMEPPARWDPQDVLIVRPQADVDVGTLAPGQHAFLGAILDGRRVDGAAGAALREHAGFDLGESLIHLIRRGAVVAIASGDAEETPT